MPAKDRYWTDPELHRRRRREQYQRRRQRELADRRDYYQSHRDHERQRERDRYWRNRQQQQFDSATRRALRSQAECELTAEQWLWVLRRHGHRCAYCGAAETLVEPLQLDHAVALSLGGRHALGNVLPACPSCNRRKSKRELEEWLEELQAASASTREEGSRFDSERVLRELGSQAQDWEIEQQQAGIEQGPALSMEAAA